MKYSPIQWHPFFLQVVFILLLAIVLNACTVTQTTVGTFNQSVGPEVSYAKGKQLWVFWGLIPLGRTDLDTPEDGNCVIITKYNPSDFLISYFSGGIITSQTIEVRVRK